MNVCGKKERGSAVLESLLSMMLLCMILFGVLQLFQLALADMIADYAAFRGARSAAVGYNRRVAEREAYIKSVPASGSMVFPDPGIYDDFQFIDTEKTLLTSFQKSREGVQYAYWSGKERFHLNYLCPYYGEPMFGGCDYCSHSARVSIFMSPDNAVGDKVTFRFTFRKYPLNIPLYDWFEERDTDNDSKKEYPLDIPLHDDGIPNQSSVNISGQAELADYSSAFLME